jgi:hypothetical protein
MAEPGGVCSLFCECFVPPTVASLPLATVLGFMGKCRILREEI